MQTTVSHHVKFHPRREKESVTLVGTGIKQGIICQRNIIMRLTFPSRYNFIILQSYEYLSTFF